MVRSDSPLVKTIAAQGPINPLNMFEAGKQLIESVAKLFASFGGSPATIERSDKSIRWRLADRAFVSPSASARHRRDDRQVARKGNKDKAGETGGRWRRAGLAAGAPRSPGARLIRASVRPLVEL
jgi:hypothetical protein